MKLRRQSGGQEGGASAPTRTRSLAQVGAVAALATASVIPIAMLARSADGARPAPVDLAVAQCTALRLPTLAGGHGNATAVGHRGTVVGIADDGRGRHRPVIWQGRSLSVLRLPPRFRGALPVAVNARGVVVGTAFDRKAQMPVGWWWRAADRVRLLPVPRGDVAFPEAIDDAGRIAGAVMTDEEHTEGEAVDDVERAVLWTSARAQPQILGPLSGDEGAHAFALSPDGRVGGVSSGAGFRPVVWDSGGRPSALGTAGRKAGAVHAFTNDGRPAGDVVATGAGMRAVTWDSERRPHDHGDAPGESTVVASAGQLLAGVAHPPGQDNGALTQALLWDGGRPLALPLPMILGGPAVGTVAVGASRTATGPVVVGYAVARDGTRTPVRWNCG